MELVKELSQENTHSSPWRQKIFQKKVANFLKSILFQEQVKGSQKNPFFGEGEKKLDRPKWGAEMCKKQMTIP